MFRLPSVLWLYSPTQQKTGRYSGGDSAIRFLGFSSRLSIRFSHVFGPRSPLHGTKIGDKLSPRIRKHGRLVGLDGWSFWVLCLCLSASALSSSSSESTSSSSSSSLLPEAAAVAVVAAAVELQQQRLHAANGGGAGFS